MTKSEMIRISRSLKFQQIEEGPDIDTSMLSEQRRHRRRHGVRACMNDGDSSTAR